MSLILGMDTGGTTTDIANIENGTIKIKKTGAKVGGSSMPDCREL